MPSRPWQKRLRALIVWGGLAAGSSAFCLLMLQALFGRQLEQLQTIQLGRELALNVRLTELALSATHLIWWRSSQDLIWRWRSTETSCGTSIDRFQTSG